MRLMIIVGLLLAGFSGCILGALEAKNLTIGQFLLLSSLFFGIPLAAITAAWHTDRAMEKHEVEKRIPKRRYKPIE